MTLAIPVHKTSTHTWEVLLPFQAHRRPVGRWSRMCFNGTWCSLDDRLHFWSLLQTLEQNVSCI